jgi:hypothetical protein
MSGLELPATKRSCPCGGKAAVMERSWWQSALEEEEFRVLHVDGVNDVAEVLTIWVGPSASRPPFFLTVAEVDWPALLAHFTDPVVTTGGEVEAMLAHTMLLSKMREMMAPDNQGDEIQSVA